MILHANLSKRQLEERLQQLQSEKNELEIVRKRLLLREKALKERHTQLKCSNMRNGIHNDVISHENGTSERPEGNVRPNTSDTPISHPTNPQTSPENRSKKRKIDQLNKNVTQFNSFMSTLKQGQLINWSDNTQQSTLLFPLLHRIATRSLLLTGNKLTWQQLANALEFCANQCPQGNIQIAQEEKKTAKQSLRRLQVIEGREDAGIVAEHGHSQQRTCDDTVQLDLQDVIESGKEELDQIACAFQRIKKHTTKGTFDQHQRTEEIIQMRRCWRFMIFLKSSESVDENLKTRLFRAYLQFDSDRMDCHEDATPLEFAWALERSVPLHSQTSQIPKTTVNENAATCRNEQVSLRCIENSYKTYKRPFDPERDSVLLQLHSKKPRSERIDPMKILCFYELNGVCNDTNCEFQHQGDIERSAASDSNVSESKSQNGSDSFSFLSPVAMMELDSFFQLRENISEKFVLLAPQAVTMRNEGVRAVEKREDPTEHTQSAGNEEYLALETKHDTNEQVCNSQSTSRYFVANDNHMITLSQLEHRVSEDPQDADAWILYALQAIEWPESNSPLTLHGACLHAGKTVTMQMIALHRLCCNRLNDAETLCGQEFALNRLSKALEVEGKAFSESLWLLYLNLFRHTAKLEENDDQLLEMTEQALQFLPSSYHLWLFYLSISPIRSIQIAEALFPRVLHFLLSRQENGNNDSIDHSERSAAITNIILQFCSQYCASGRSKSALSILNCLQEDTQTSDNDILSWLPAASKALHHRERFYISLIYIHVLLTDELPSLTLRNVQSCHVADVEQLGFVIEQFLFTRELFWRHQLIDPTVRERMERAFVRGCTLLEKADAQNCEKASVIAYGNIMWTCRLLFEANANRIDARGSEYDASLRNAPRACWILKEIQTHLSIENRTDLNAKALETTSEDTANFIQHLYYYLLSTANGIGSKENSHEPFSLQSNCSIQRCLEKFAVAVGYNFQTSSTIENDQIKQILHDITNAWMQKLYDTESSLGIDIYIPLSACLLLRRFSSLVDATDLFNVLLESDQFTRLSISQQERIWLQYLSVRTSDVKAPNDTVLCDLQRFLQHIISTEAVNTSEILTRRISSENWNADTMPKIESIVVEALTFRVPSTFISLWKVFDMTLSLVPQSKRMAFMSRYASPLGHLPAFCIRMAHLAKNEWDWKQTFAASYKSLIVSTSLFDASNMSIRRSVIKVFLISVLEQQLPLTEWHWNALQHVLHRHTNSKALWELVFRLEMMLGKKDSNRSKALVTSIQQAGVCVDTFALAGLDAKHSDEKHVSPIDGIASLSRSTILFAFANLQELQLSNNFLVELPSEISLLHRLVTLNIANNSLLALPPSLSQLSSLQTADFSYNNLWNISNVTWTKFHNLKCLDVRGNLLTHIPKSIGGIQSLVRLCVKGNLSNLTWHKVSPLLSMRMATERSHTHKLGIDIDPRKPTLSALDAFTESNETTRKSENGREAVEESDEKESETMRESDEKSQTAESVEVTVTPTKRIEDDTESIESIQMKFDQIQAKYNCSRAEIKKYDATLWTQFIKMCFPFEKSLGSCVLCGAKEEEICHQRLNTMVLCVSCITIAINCIQHN
ncbi:unnamed protein product [Albugo candida]|uniref:Putative zinc-finger domain-containing protein n=1 Tax=Albugo candida TaxID=65357 RepID=A0A024GL80_9STRA|nr:unnamed protein product [Albugo candida]|eukprot:CCI47513.1 unnamed protein product [Albugo candida]